MGPFPLPQGGTLTSAQRQDIWQRTGVSACVRWRAQWQQRCLTLSGPADWLNEGKRLAEAAIQANGSEHGRQEEDQPAQTHDVDELRRRFDWLHQYYHGQIATLQNQLDQVSRRASEAYDKAVELTEILEKKNKKKQTKNGRELRRKRSKTMKKMKNTHEMEDQDLQAMHMWKKKAKARLAEMSEIQNKDKKKRRPHNSHNRKGGRLQGDLRQDLRRIS